MTNVDFAERMGIHFSMSSRLRNGQRLPSAPLLDRISQEFDIPLDVLMAAYRKGSSDFGNLLREKVFDQPDTVAV